MDTKISPLGKYLGLLLWAIKIYIVMGIFYCVNLVSQTHILCAKVWAGCGLCV